MAIRFLVEGQASGGSVAGFEFDVPAGAKVPAAHSHYGCEETIYGLAGVLTFTVNGRRRREDARHRHSRHLGPDYFREIAAVVAAATSGPPDPAAIAEVMRRHGLTPAP